MFVIRSNQYRGSYIERKITVVSWSLIRRELIVLARSCSLPITSLNFIIQKYHASKSLNLLRQSSSLLILKQLKNCNDTYPKRTLMLPWYVQITSLKSFNLQEKQTIHRCNSRFRESIKIYAWLRHRKLS